ncbi:MAG: amidohydrolase family protein [Xanthobacteraceae bacterium]
MDRVSSIIDFHVHFLEQQVCEQCLPHSVATNRGQHHLPPHLFALFEKMMKPQSIIEDMDRLGIDLSVVSSATVIEPTHWAEPDVALNLSRRLNDTAAEWVAAFPKRIIGSFVLPLQDVNLSLTEFKRAIEELDLKVANVPAEIRGTYLGDARFRPFWALAQDSGVVVFMHPDGAKDSWFFQWGMWNSLGQSLEEAKFMSSVIYEGILESYPKLKLVIAHGGGYFPHNMGRLDRNAKNAPQSMKNINRKPSEYLRNVYYDTCLYDPTVLSALIKIVGPDRLLLGSDWPIGEADPVGFVDRCSEIDDATKRMINGGQAAKLVGASQ